METLPCGFVWMGFIVPVGQSWNKKFPGQGKEKALVDCALLG